MSGNHHYCTGYSASRMNTVLKYVILLDLLNCHIKFHAIRSAVVEKMMFEVVILGNFTDIPELKLSLPP